MCSAHHDHEQRAEDPRPARTRAAILAAIERIGAHSEDLTVAAIVSEARIARSSFYSQFRDIGDVAVQLISELYERIAQLDAELRSTDSGRVATRAALGILLDELRSHPGLYRAVLSAGVSSDARREIRRIMAAGAVPALSATAPSGLDLQTASTYIAGGVLEALTEWLLSDEPSPPEMLLDQLISLLPQWVAAE